MAEKTLNTRIIHKHDTAENWGKAENFIPNKGELIVYDVDDGYNYERFKIGDGAKLVDDLPFVLETIDAITIAEIDEICGLLYTNLIETAKDASGAVYNGTGWKGGIRVSGSAGTEKTESDAAVTGYIEVKANDIIRIDYKGAAQVWDYGISSSKNVLAYYDASHNWLGSVTSQPAVYGICAANDAPNGTVANGCVTAIVPNNSEIAYVRMSCASNNNSMLEVILTVNEEIV